MTKFVNDAGLAYFKGKIDENFLDKKKGGTVENAVTFNKEVSINAAISGNNSQMLGIAGIKADTKIYDSNTEKVWNYSGGAIPVGKANGLATLGADGKIPLEQLGNIDTTFVEVLTDISKLPTTNIGKHIYLVPDTAAASVGKNKYAEYVYTGALPISTTNVYDASKWEKLGDFQAEVDLTDYSTKDKTVGAINVGTSENNLVIRCMNLNSAKVDEDTIPAATTTAAGVMTAADKKVLDKLAARYPLQFAGISINPSVYELGTSIQPTVTWIYSNEDFHTVGQQKITSTDSNIIGGIGLDGNVRSYKPTNAYTVPTSENKKSDTITVTTGDISKAVGIVGVHAGYCGVVEASKASLTAAEIIALGNKAVINGRSRTVSITQKNQKLVYAYPAYFGDLTSIKDGNGFQGFSGYTKLTAVTVNGTSYNVYMQNTPATATGSYTFA